MSSFFIIYGSVLDVQTFQPRVGVVERHLRARLAGPAVGQAQGVDVLAVERAQLPPDPRPLDAEVGQGLGAHMRGAAF